MNSTSMRVWAGLFVLVVFVAGVAGGVALRPWMPLGQEEPGPWFGQRGPRGERPPGPPTGRLLERIAGQIELTEDQDARLREVFESRGQRMREINEQVRGLFETERTQMNDEIAAILTPEQMETFDQEIVRMRGMRGRPGGRGGPRGPGFRRFLPEDAPR